jgi:hypothetical protein
MGARANLVLVNESGHRLFYCHWCANSICEVVFLGPEFAIPYILELRETTDCLDDIWTEGALLVDNHHQVVLLCGSEDIDYNIPLRRLFLGLMREVWTGWDIRWAYEGIVDQVNYLGLPKSLVIADRSEEERITAEHFSLPEDLDRINTIISIIFEDGSLHLYPITSWRSIMYIAAGPSMVDIAQQVQGLDEAIITHTTNIVPNEGIHIDVSHRTVSYWASRVWGLPENLNTLWSGWELRWLGDNFEHQLAETRGKLTFLNISADELLSRLERQLAQNNRQIFDNAVAAWRRRRALV